MACELNVARKVVPFSVAQTQAASRADIDDVFGGAGSDDRYDWLFRRSACRAPPLTFMLRPPAIVTAAVFSKKRVESPWCAMAGWRRHK